MLVRGQFRGDLWPVKWDPGDNSSDVQTNMLSIQYRLSMLHRFRPSTARCLWSISTVTTSEKPSSRMAAWQAIWEEGECEGVKQQSVPGLLPWVVTSSMSKTVAASTPQERVGSAKAENTVRKGRGGGSTIS